MSQLLFLLAKMIFIDCLTVCRIRVRSQGYEQLRGFSARGSAEDVYDNAFSHAHQFPGRISRRRVFRRDRGNLV